MLFICDLVCSLDDCSFVSFLNNERKIKGGFCFSAMFSDPLSAIAVSVSLSDRIVFLYKCYVCSWNLPFKCLDCVPL